MTAQIVGIVAQLAVLAAVLWLVRAGRAPTATLPTPSRAVDGSFVRLTDYEADLAGIRRQIKDIEASAETRHAAVMGNISQMRSGSKRDQREEQRAAVLDAITEHKSARAEGEQAPAARGGRIVKILRQRQA